MRRLLSPLLLSLLLPLVLAVRPCAAWNDAGHMTVAAVAYLKLAPEVRARVDALLRQHPDFAKLSAGFAADDPDFGLRVFLKAATWPDMIKGDPRFWDDQKAGATPTPPLPGFPDMAMHKPWHYRDEGISFDGTPVRPADPVNALTQIVALRGTLGDPGAPAAARAYALSWLEHLVGDVHQPLHAVARFSALHPDGDAGGNGFKLDGPDPKYNLHWFWDDALSTDPDPQRVIAAAHGVMGDYAVDDRELGPWADPQTAVLEWLEESATVARYVLYTVAEERAQPPYPKVPDSYRAVANGIARHRVAVAGYRLAVLISDRLRTP